MNHSSRVLGIALGLGVAAVWLGACGSSSGAPCGAGGAQNGTCQSGPLCPSGQTEIFIDGNKTVVFS